MVTDADEDAAARAALAEFGMPADAVLTFVKYRENRVYRVDTGDASYSLRMHRPGYRDDAHLRDEVRTLDHLASHGADVPRPVLTRNGDHVAVVHDRAGTRRQATMQRWIDNTVGFGDSGAVFEGRATPTLDELERLGRLTAELHDLLREQGTPPDYSRPAWDARGLTGPTALWGSAHRLAGLDGEARATLLAADRRAAAVLDALPRDADRYGVIHADLTFENVLVAADRLVAIDFDDSGEGWYAFDLATPAFWCVGHPDAEQFIGALESGYRAGRAASDVIADEDTWQALLITRALSYLGWAADRPGDPTSEYLLEVVAPPVVAAARHYVESGSTGWPSLANRTTTGERKP